VIDCPPTLPSKLFQLIYDWFYIHINVNSICECFLILNDMGMTKKYFVVIQGGKLYINTNIGQVDHRHKRDGLTPSVGNIVRMFRKLLTNEGILCRLHAILMTHRHHAICHP
jgi:hypothetical protein